MRAILTLLAGAVVALALTAHADPSPQSDQGVNRPGGAYANMAIAGPNACALICAHDQLCMAWSFQSSESICELKAVIPQPVDDPAYASGLSARAPAFARRLTRADPEPAPIAPAPPPEAPADQLANAPPPAPHLPPEDAQRLEVELLGGRVAQADLGLRRRFGE